MSKDVVCGGKSKSGVCVCTYLQVTPPGHRCPSGTGAPAQTSHSPGYPRSPASKNENKEQKNSTAVGPCKRQQNSSKIFPWK